MFFTTTETTTATLCDGTEVTLTSRKTYATPRAQREYLVRRRISDAKTNGETIGGPCFFNSAETDPAKAAEAKEAARRETIRSRMYRAHGLVNEYHEAYIGHSMRRVPSASLATPTRYTWRALKAWGPTRRIGIR